jgi:hypothetical protein
LARDHRKTRESSWPDQELAQSQLANALSSEGMADKFTNGEFAMLLRVFVVDNQNLAPDLQDPEARLYERSPNEDGAQ